MLENHVSDKPIYKVHQHKIILFTNWIVSFFKYGIITSIVLYFLFRFSPFLQLIFLLLVPISFFVFYWFFWSQSFFYITNEKIVIKVRNGIFSNFYMSIYFKNIRDLAYSKNNILHYFFDYGTFFARSSAGALGDFEVPYIPQVEKVYQIINALYLFSEEERKKIVCLEDLKQEKVEQSIEGVIHIEREKLLSLQGIKGVILLNENDRRYIFEHEEEKNHGVYECLKRKVLFCLVHDSSFRNPDGPIVLKLGNKVIFPAVSFHEIARPSTVSSSPGVEIHQYLSKNFSRLAPDDATILVGFDL